MRTDVRAPRPFVFVNMAMTADGKIATFNRQVSSFSSPRDQEHLYELRATADAVMAGARTVDLNTIKMGPGGKRFREQRKRNGLKEYNLRVIVSGAGSINSDAPLFKARFSPIIILTTERCSLRARKRLEKVADEVVVCGEKEIDFRFALHRLREQWNVRRLLSEGGGELNFPLFQRGLVDELHLTICPRIFGGRSAPTICDGNGINRLAAATQLQLAKVTRESDELFLVFRAPRRKRGGAQ